MGTQPWYPDSMLGALIPGGYGQRREGRGGEGKGTRRKPVVLLGKRGELGFQPWSSTRHSHSLGDRASCCTVCSCVCLHGHNDNQVRIPISDFATPLHSPFRETHHTRHTCTHAHMHMPRAIRVRRARIRCEGSDWRFLLSRARSPRERVWWHPILCFE